MLWWVRKPGCSLSLCYHLTRTSHQLPRLFWIHQCGGNSWLVPRLHLLGYFSRNNKFGKGFWLSSLGVSWEHRRITRSSLLVERSDDSKYLNTSVFAGYCGRCFLLGFLGGIHVPFGRALLCLLRFWRREEPYLPWDEVKTTNSTHIWRRRQDLNTAGPHWWEERALTTAPSVAPHACGMIMWSCGNRSGGPAKENVVT